MTQRSKQKTERWERNIKQREVSVVEDLFFRVDGGARTHDLQIHNLAL